MIIVRHMIAPAALMAVLLTGCQAIATTGLALGNRLSSSQSEGSTRIPLNPDDGEIDTLGDLEYRGGLSLTAHDERFGGLSGLLVSADGTRFLGVSDKGYWITGKLLYEDGHLTGVKQIEITPMAGLKGQPIEGKTLGDAESLIGDLDGRVLVSFERQHRIWAYDLSADGFAARPTPVTLPPEVSNIQSNGGLEGIARLKDKAGTLLVLTEATTDPQGNFKGWLIRPGGSFALSLKAMEPFKLTDLAVLPSGDVLTLERRFTLLGGPGFQIRRIGGATLQPGAILDGPVLANAGLPWSVDNMEGLDVRVTQEGKILLYIVSDDNFNPLQRTLLMMFELNE